MNKFSKRGFEKVSKFLHGSYIKFSGSIGTLYYGKRIDFRTIKYLLRYAYYW